MMTLHNTSPVYLIVLINSGNEVFVIVTLIKAKSNPSSSNIFEIRDLRKFHISGSEDEARHSQIRSHLPRTVGGSSQLQAEGKGELIIRVIPQ